MSEVQIMYRATQTGTTSFCILVAVGVLIYFIGRLTPAPPWSLWLIFAVLLAVGFCTSSMTIEVAKQTVTWYGTLGIFRQSLDIVNIAAITVVQLPFISGYGLRLGGNSAMWRVSGSSAVRLLLTDGRTIFLGSAEPERLAAAIRSAQ